MALPDSLKIIIGTEIVVAHSTYVPTIHDLGTITHDIDVTDLANGTARESEKIDFGANIDLEYVLASCVEWEVSPEIAAGETLDFYIGWSRTAAPGDDNPGGLTGADNDYAGLAGGSLAGTLQQLQFIGSHVMDNVITTDDIGVQFDSAVATFTPRNRYGILVVVNSAASAALFSAVIETAFSMTPLIHQVQD